MLLNAVIIILREVIEAALLISILLAFSHRIQVSRRWLIIALLTGTATATIYAANINDVSQWLDGVGQEIINASLQFMIYILLLLFVTLAAYAKRGYFHKAITGVMVLCVTLAIMREGSEIILYIHGFARQPELLKAVLFGGAIGAGIGLSTGVLFYYVLVNLSVRIGVKVGFSLCLLVAGGMIIQATQLLMQADWINSQYPLWDTSMWINERSLIGQILYALISYEATPTSLQVIAYISAIVIMFCIAHFARRHSLRLQ